MNGEVNSEKLISKFRDGSIEAEELALLLNYFKDKDLPEDLKELFTSYWESSSYNNDELDSELIWNEISDKIGGTFLPSQSVNNLQKQNKPLWSVVLKYAAVFLLAFGLSWFIHSIVSNETFIEGSNFTKIEVPYGSKSKIELPDGTEVILNSGSFIQYPGEFKRKTREVYFEGEAFFNVKKDKNRQFIVNTSDISIKVLGTTFNVKAYPEDKNIETTLITGRVEVYYKDKNSNGRELIVMHPNQKLVIARPESKGSSGTSAGDHNPVTMVKKEPIKIEVVSNPDLYISWKDNKLEFDNERFEDLVGKFERWYDVEITIEAPEIKDARLSGRFEKENIEQALQALNLTVQFNYTMNKNKVTIYRKTNNY